MAENLFLVDTEEVLKQTTGKSISLSKTKIDLTDHIVDSGGEGGGLPVKENPQSNLSSSWPDYGLEQMSPQPMAHVRVKLRTKKK